MALRPIPPRSRKARRLSQQQSLTAAAESLLTRLEKQGAGGGQIGEPWQREVWDLYDRVPELRTAARITGGAMSQCRLVIARAQQNGEPAPLKPDEEHPAKDALRNFAGGEGGQAALLDSLGVFLTTSGESILVGALDPQDARGDDFLRMQAYSPDQVQKRGRTVTVRMAESSAADRVVTEIGGTAPGGEPEDETGQVAAIRIWRPHPRFNWQADSAARSSLTVLREIAMYDSHIAASGISRLAGAGLLGIPDGITLPGLAEDDPDNDGTTDPFLQLLMQVMSLAIRDRDSAAALVPILLRGNREDIAALKDSFMTFSTPFDEKVSPMRDAAIGRFAAGVDMPKETLTGLGDTQGWVGTLITDDWKKTHLQQLMGLACGSLTSGWLWPYLARTAPDTTSDIVLWFDDSSVRTRENTGPEAQGAVDRLAINDASYRRALGYDDSDAVDLTTDVGKRQLLVSILLKAPVSMAPLVLPQLGLDLTPEMLEKVQKLATALNASTAAQAQGIGGPSNLPPETGNSAIPEPRTMPGAAAAAAHELERLVRGGV